MKPKDGETYKSWLERARMYEQGLALQKIAQGEDPERVLEELSRRLMEKMLHPIYKLLHDTAETDYNAEQNKQKYEEAMKGHKPVADQVDGNLFDKSDEN